MIKLALNTWYVYPGCKLACLAAQAENRVSKDFRPMFTTSTADKERVTWAAAWSPCASTHVDYGTKPEASVTVMHSLGEYGRKAGAQLLASSSALLSKRWASRTGPCSLMASGKLDQMMQRAMAVGFPGKAKLCTPLSWRHIDRLTEKVSDMHCKWIYSFPNSFPG